MIEINDILKELSNERPIFHSEADFQHALAWQIHLIYPKSNIRIEKRFIAEPNNKVYIDIIVFNDKKAIAIELKYKTKNLRFTSPSKTCENFILKSHDAPDFGRYDFLKDISRIEFLKSKKMVDYGYAIFLTNDSEYWNVPKNYNTQDKQFRIHEKCKLHGILEWEKKNNVSEDSTNMKSEKKKKSSRDDSIILKSNYTMNWKLYSNLQTEAKNNTFMILTILI